MPSRYFVAGLLAVLLIITLLGSALSALAQVPCGPADKIQAALVQGGNKLAVDLTMRTDTGLVPMRIYANPKSKRWVLITLSEDGNACLILIGEGFEPARLPGSDA